MRKRFAVPRGERGFTLIEIMLAVGMSAILVLVVAQILQTMMSQSKTGNEDIAFEDDLLRLQYFLELPFRTAVGVTSTGAIANTQGLGAGTGLLANFQSDYSAASDDGTTHVIALFMREKGSLDLLANPTYSTLRATGVYFTQPAGTTYGMLYVDMGGGAALAPTRSVITYPRMTQFKVSNILTGSGGVVKSFNVTVGMRMQTGVKQKPLVYCDPAHVTGICDPSGVRLRDISRTFTIKLLDNVNPAASPTDFPLFGRLYFMK